MGPEPIPGCLSPGAHIWGWMSPVELDWLHETAGRMSSVAEVGSLRGRSSYALLKGCPGPVYCIDPWNDVGGVCYPDFLTACGGFPNLRPVKGYSPGVIYSDDLPDVDMVFIDGAHDEESVRADIGHWTPKTRKLICGHDYIPEEGAGFPDVAKVVDEIFGSLVTVAPDTAIWCVEIP